MEKYMFSIGSEYKNRIKLRNLFFTTLNLYLIIIKEFLYNFNKIADETLKDYLLYPLNKKESTSFQKQKYIAIIILYQMFCILKGFSILNYKKDSKLLKVLYRKHVKIIIYFIINRKHKLLIQFFYLSGLRGLVLIEIKSKDIDFVSTILYTWRSRRNETKISIFSSTLKDSLLKYFLANHLKNFLFQINGNKKFTLKAIEKIFEISFKTVIVINVIPSTLWCSFLPQLFEMGIDFRKCQKLQGYKNLRTTQIYNLVSNIDLENIKRHKRSS